MSDPFSDIPQVQGSMGGPLVNFVKIILQRLAQGAKALPGEAGAAAAPLQEELTSQALSGPFQGLVGAPMRGMQGLPSADEIAQLQAVRPNVGPATQPGVDPGAVAQSMSPDPQVLPRIVDMPDAPVSPAEAEQELRARRGDRDLARRRAESQRTGASVDDAMAELEFSARSTGKPSEGALARLEEAVVQRNGPEHAQRLMQRVRAKFELGAEAEPQGSVIDALRGMGDGVAPQDMESAANVYARLRDEEAAQKLGLEGGFPENVTPPSRFERAHNQREMERAFHVFDPKTEEGYLGSFRTEQEAKDFIAKHPEGRRLDYGQEKDISSTSEFGAPAERRQEDIAYSRRLMADAKVLGSAAEHRVAQTPRFLQSLRQPSAEPTRLQEAALRARAEQAGVTVGDAGSARILVDDDTVAETITGLTKKGESEALGHMYTNPSTGQVRMSVLASKPQRLVQIGFPDRTAAFRWVAANMGQERRATMLNAERLEAFQRAQEASMGKPVGQILLD